MERNLTMENIPAIAEKHRKLQETLADMECSGRVTPEQAAQAMLRCGRSGDYASLLEQCQRAEKGIDAFLAVHQNGKQSTGRILDQVEEMLPESWESGERANFLKTLLLSLDKDCTQEELAGLSLEQVREKAVAQLEQSAGEMRAFLTEEAAAWPQEESAGWEEGLDPFLTAVVLDWAQAEGDIQMDAPHELIGIQMTVVSTARAYILDNGWEEFLEEVLEYTVEALLLASIVCLYGGLLVESGALLMTVGFGLMIAASVFAIVGELVIDYWDELADFFSRLREAWRRRFRSEDTVSAIEAEAVTMTDHLDRSVNNVESEVRVYA